MIKGKKGQEMIVDIFSYLLFIIIILTFIILLFHQEKETRKNIATGVRADFYETRLLILMRQPITGTYQTFAEMIIDSPYNDYKKDFVSKEITNTFDKEWGEWWDFTVYTQKPLGREQKKWDTGYSFTGQAAVNILKNFIAMAVGSKIPLPLSYPVEISVTLPGHNNENIIVKFRYWMIA
ncbi:MAG: hypothetical protein KJ583_02575 [Nanoarchaeota archaeon]|nr:hypothetical protein [Nanoarchaeota archaeon]MBU1269938.1 hypothetical protein [Nanoarchaeota archaeon]MBU1604179.1 hypothetical protein [Nanoarchaeota archaeon]MBU2443080.1 hypothetical protein [Nanoarchaeota archaeon]